MLTVIKIINVDEIEDTVIEDILCTYTSVLTYIVLVRACPL